MLRKGQLRIKHRFLTKQEKQLRCTAYGGIAEQICFSYAMCIFEKLKLFKKIAQQYNHFLLYENAVSYKVKNC